MAKEYVKHLIECKCTLPQFREKDIQIQHKFVVFSVIKDDGGIVPSYAECNNCGSIHKVLEVGISKRLPKETIAALPRKSEVGSMIPEPVRVLLESYRCELPTWQEAAFIYSNELWGRPVILSKETDEDLVVGKYIIIFSREAYKVETYTSGDNEEENE